MSLIDTIDNLLPQTQCGECGYPGCRPYAEAMASGSAPLNKCPPGGVSVLKALGDVLCKDVSHLEDEVAQKTRPPAKAWIREEECIGCKKCLNACPVDAIVGASKFMHSIIAQECTGCGLCVEPCPVDCIDLIEDDKATFDKTLAKSRFRQKNIRQLQEKQAKEVLYREKRTLAATSSTKLADKREKQSFILDALARVKAKHDKNS